ncbi:hypothetical protein [Microlunatus speluncae]|uniref:hypothetical protein n=1 Tax=Microlunatus speluncae TaxID=2594267 RepID=UPI001266306D|nr:hypothetical protein [Microlunatus speluncae]
MAARFPPRPIRAVRELIVPRGNCGPFADITLDFEPAETGFVFEIADGVTADWEWPEYGPVYLEWVGTGVEEELRHEDHGLIVAVRVILQAARMHPVDSREQGFQRAGTRAAKQAIALAFGGSGEELGAPG